MTKIDFDFPNSSKIDRLSLPAVAYFNGLNSQRAISPLYEMPHAAAAAYNPILIFFICSSQQSQDYGLGVAVNSREVAADAQKAKQYRKRACDLFLETHLNAVGKPKDESAYATFEASIKTFELCTTLLNQIVTERITGSRNGQRSQIYKGSRTLARSANEACYRFRGVEALNAVKEEMAADVSKLVQVADRFKLAGGKENDAAVPKEARRPLWSKRQQWYQDAAENYLKNETDAELKRTVAEFTGHQPEEFDITPELAADILPGEAGSIKTEPLIENEGTYSESRLDLAISELLNYYRPMSLIQSLFLTLGAGTAGLFLGSFDWISRPELTCLLCAVVAGGIGLNQHSRRMKQFISVIDHDLQLVSK